MAKSQLTFRKKEQAKKKRQKKEEKMERRAFKKLDNDKGKSLEEMYVYVDKDGNLSSTPPTEPYVFDVKDLEGPVNQEDIYRLGVVAFYNEIGRYGFIRDQETRETVYFNDTLAGFKLDAHQQVKFKSIRSRKGTQIAEVILL